MADLSRLKAIQEANTTKDIAGLLSQKIMADLSPEDKREQAISYVMSMLPSDTTMTRDQVRAFVDSHYGKLS